jgi:GAF domain-containing protein
VYADFGRREAVPVDLDLLEMFAAQAGLALESILYRARAEKASPRMAAPTAHRQAGASPWT